MEVFLQELTAIDFCTSLILMHMKTKNHAKTLFDEDIVIDESLFSNFKISEIASWSHLALWCMINGIDINYAFFKGILCGISVF